MVVRTPRSDGTRPPLKLATNELATNELATNVGTLRQTNLLRGFCPNPEIIAPMCTAGAVSTCVLGWILREHYKTPTLGPSLGTAVNLGPSLGGALVGFSLGPRLPQGLACLGGALVDGNPPRLISFCRYI